METANFGKSISQESFYARLRWFLPFSGKGSLIGDGNTFSPLQERLTCMTNQL